MIQRIQTLYLFLALVASILLFFFPFANLYSASLVNYDFSVLALEKISPLGNELILRPILLMALLSVVIVLVIASILMFKNRVQQMRVVAISFFVNAILLISIYFFTDKFASTYDATVNYKNFGMLLPIFNIVMFLLANKAIKSDEIKVRKSQRIR